MKYTSAEANKLLKRLMDEEYALIQQESMRYTFIAATVENIEDVRPVYDFAATQKKIDEYDAAIREVKHAINRFNTTTTVPEFDMKIDEMLVYLPQLKRQKDKLATMFKRLPKNRKGHGYGEKASNFIEYEYANYDIEAAKKLYEEVSDRLVKAQLWLDKVNNDLKEIELEINL